MIEILTFFMLKEVSTQLGSVCLVIAWPVTEVTAINARCTEPSNLPYN